MAKNQSNLNKTSYQLYTQHDEYNCTSEMLNIGTEVTRQLLCTYYEGYDTLKK